MTRPPTHPKDDLVPWDHLVDERLVDLALDEAMEAAEREHLASCDVCRGALAGLSRTIHVAREASFVELVPPGAGLWSRISADLDTDLDDADDAADLGGAEPDRPADPVPAPLRPEAAPDVAVLPAPVETSSSPEVVVPLRPADRRRGPGRGRPALGWLAAACVAGVLLGAGGVVAADRLGDDPAPTVASRTVATAQLDTLDTAQQRGTATVSERADSVTLDVAARDLQPAGGGYVEVWLINRDLKRMVSVGVLDDGGVDQSFPISRRLLDEGYVIVDLSREQFDDQPQHSGDSLVRGALTSRA